MKQRKLHKNTNKSIYGVGISDADYTVQPNVDGKMLVCSFYRVWHSMLNRCYSSKLQDKRPTYMGCTVCEEWLTFSNFKSWMEQQDWVGKQLDKDLLVEGNKVYCPQTCVFVDRVTNSFITDSAKNRGKYMIGVVYFKPDNKSRPYRAKCNNPFTRKQEHLGYFATELEAHKAWQAKKHEYSCRLADLQQDSRVAEALRKRYAPDTDWTKR